jgi:uncharacterized protein YecE (DUF72 family)
MVELSRYQRWAKEEREQGSNYEPTYTPAELKQIAGAARQWSKKDFKPYGYSPSSAIAVDE